MEKAGGLAQLLEVHRSELLRFLRARCGDADLGEDLFQELWLKASAAPSSPIANGRAYLFRMANNVVADYRRSQTRSMRRDYRWLEDAGGNVPQDVRPDPAMAADDAIAQRQEADILAAAIADLPDGARRALHLHRFEGHRQSEVAAIMGISQSGVEKHLALAMAKLRASLADCGFFGTATSKSYERRRVARAPTDKET